MTAFLASALFFFFFLHTLLLSHDSQKSVTGLRLHQSHALKPESVDSPAVCPWGGGSDGKQEILLGNYCFPLGVTTSLPLIDSYTPLPVTQEPETHTDVCVPICLHL